MKNALFWGIVLISSLTLAAQEPTQVNKQTEPVTYWVRQAKESKFKPMGGSYTGEMSMIAFLGLCWFLYGICYENDWRQFRQITSQNS